MNQESQDINKHSSFTADEYEVIADYPGTPFKVGDIIKKHKYLSGKWYIPGMCSDPDDFPHLFKKLNGITIDYKFWLSKATRFDLGKCLIYHRPVLIELNCGLWVLKMEYTHSWFLGRDGSWHYEDVERTDMVEFRKLIHWNNPQEVYDFWKENIKEMKPLYVK